MAELGAIGGEDDVTKAGQLTSPAQGRPLDRRNGKGVSRRQLSEDIVKQADHLGHAVCRVVRHVHSGAECLARTAHEQRRRVFPR